jgi:hypothetical protein
MKRLPFMLAIAVLPFFAQANDNLSISGFGSLVAGQVLDGSGYVAEYPNVGAYDDEFDIGQETRLGMQAITTISSELSATMQVMTRANNNYKPEVEWLFANYTLNDSVDLQAGKLRVPVYYFSEYMDVGYAYPWIRVPSDAYSLDLTSFNGLQLNHRTYVGSLDISTAIFGGRQPNTGDNELMSFLFGGNVQRSFTGLVGVGVELATETTTAKISVSQADMTQVRSNSFNVADDGISKESISFIDIFIKQSMGAFAVMLEYNNYDPFYTSYFLSGTYQMGKVNYYIMTSQFELDAEIGGTPIEEHNTNSFGARYDYQPRIAFKVDISMITDTGFFAVNKDPSDGDAMILSTGIDFIF